MMKHMKDLEATSDLLDEYLEIQDLLEETPDPDEVKDLLHQLWEDDQEAQKKIEEQQHLERGDEWDEYAEFFDYFHTYCDSMDE